MALSVGRQVECGGHVGERLGVTDSLDTRCHC